MRITIINYRIKWDPPTNKNEKTFCYLITYLHTCVLEINLIMNRDLKATVPPLVRPTVKFTMQKNLF